MKLLVISNNPSRPSFRQRIEMYLDLLRADGIDSEVHKLSKDYIKRWNLFSRAELFDAVLVHKKCFNLLDARCLRRHSRKIIYDFDDAVMYKADQPESEHTSHKRLFERMVKLADCVIAGNEYLAQHARHFNLNVHVLPTGLSIDDYKSSATKSNNGKVRLVWIGSKATLKYLEQLRPVLEEAGRRFDNLVLRIVCDSFFTLENTPVEQRPWSLQTQAADLSTSDIGLAPLPDNCFTRGKCAYKILQYMAAGLPVIASPVGANRQYVEESGAGRLADNEQQWLEKITELAKDGPSRARMAKAADKYVRKFDHTILVKKFQGLIRDCVGC